MFHTKRRWIVEDRTLKPEESVKKIKNGQADFECGYRVKAGERILYLLNDSDVGLDREYAVVCVEPDNVKKSGLILGLQIESLLVDTVDEHGLLNEGLESGNPDYDGMNKPVQFHVIPDQRGKASTKKPFTANRRK